VPLVHDANRHATEPEPRTQNGASNANELARDGIVHARHEQARQPQPAEAPGPTRNALRELLASARHDLGSPLQSIQGFAELLESSAYGNVNEQQQLFLGHILTASSELRYVMEACLELAELELLGRAQSAYRVELHQALLEAVEHVQRRRGITAVVQPGPAALAQHVRVDRELFCRGIEALLVALGAGDRTTFVVAMEPAGEYARVTFARTARAQRAEALPLQELARRQCITRNLVWFRLAATSLAAQDATLSLTEQLDCAEVRIRLSSPH
jgi:His Kinase A (phospho-acceptor) domain